MFNSLSCACLCHIFNDEQHCAFCRKEEPTTVGQLAVEPDTMQHQNVRVVVGTNGLLVFIAVQLKGRSEVEIGMTPEEALAVAAALQLHAEKAQQICSDKPNA